MATPTPIKWAASVLGIAVVIVLGVTLSKAAPAAVVFKPFELDAFTAALAPLLVIAVLIERALEVFFGIVREPDDRKSEAELARARVAFAAALEGRPTLAIKLLKTPADVAATASPRELVVLGQLEVDRAQQMVDERKAVNTRVAFLAGGTLGLVVALAGARVLAMLIADTTPWLVPDSDGNVPGPPGWWTALDVFLSAGLIGGGADGFHHLTTVLSTFLRRLSEENKVQTPPPVLSRSVLRDDRA